MSGNGFNNGLKEFSGDGLKIFRDSTPLVLPEVKPNQGVEITQDMTTGEITMTGCGNEEGWLKIEKADDSSPDAERKCDAWTMVSPAMLDLDLAEVNPIKDKTMIVDEVTFAGKEMPLEPHITSNTHAQIAPLRAPEGKIGGVIVACSNHASQEQIFVPTELTKLVRIVSPANTTTGVGVIPAAVTTDGVVLEGEPIYKSGSDSYKIRFLLKYSSGKTGTPDGSEVDTGQVISIFTSTDLRLKPQKGGYGWIAFVDFPLDGTGSLVIRDLGSGSGIPTKLTNGVWVDYGVVRPLLATGDSNWHGYPWRLDNLYVGVIHANFYVVSRSGYGEIAKTWAKTINGQTLSINVDTAGKVVGVT